MTWYPEGHRPDPPAVTWLDAPATPPSPRLTSDRPRALELLAASRDGCTETVMLAHGFTVAQMVDLVRAGLRPQQPSAWLLAGGGRSIEVAQMRITEEGRRALA